MSSGGGSTGGSTGSTTGSTGGGAGAVVSAAKGAVASAGVSLSKANWGLIGWIAGVIIISISMTVQLFTLSHGTSGQLAIDTGLHAALWPVLIGAILIAVGFTMWNLLSEHKGYSYPALFMLAFSSYIMANFAIFASTKQVTVATK